MKKNGIKNKYILIYHINDFPEEGGGNHYLFFENENEIHQKVNELAKEFENNLSIIRAGYLREEFEYEPSEKIIKYEPKSIY